MNKITMKIDGMMCGMLVTRSARQYLQQRRSQPPKAGKKPRS